MNEMLKIITQMEGATIRFILEGEMMQAGARVLEQCWQRAVTSKPGRMILVDFRAVTFIDAFARELLLRMRQSGARLKAPGLVLKALFEEGGASVSIESTLEDDSITEKR